MPKLKKRDTDLDLNDDPRPKDAVMWQRLRVMVEHDAVDRAWGCPLYILHRIGWITSEQREAGDRYWKARDNFAKMHAKDPDEERDELLPRRIQKAKEVYRDCLDILGRGRSSVDTLVIYEEHLTERQKYLARDGLQLLSNYFRLGNKTRTKTPRNVV
jgi:hypothetical protein